MSKRKQPGSDARHTSFGSKIQSKKSESVNPFERLKQRANFTVMGRKLKGTERDVGQARSRSIKQRTDSLLVEYKQRGKQNSFRDMRFGENDENVSTDDKYLKRFQQERIKKSRFALEDGDEELTHMGTTLSNVVHDDYVADDGEDYGDLDEQTVESHFGGGSLGVSKNVKTVHGSNQPKTKEEVMREIINKSKLFKMDRQKGREQTDNLVSSLDEEFGNIRSILETRPSKLDLPREEPDDFELQARKFVYDARVAATDRTKSVEEIATEQAEKLKKLEAERQLRMKGESKKKRSTDDDLDLIDPEAEVLEEDIVSKDDNNSENGDSVEDGDSIEGSDEDASDFDEDDDEDEDEDEEDEQSDVFHFSESENDDYALDSVPKFIPNKKSSSKVKSAPPKATAVKFSSENDKMPYTFEAPGSLEDLISLLEPYKANEKAVVISRIRICHHISLSSENRSKLQRLYNQLWGYFRHITELYQTSIAGDKSFSWENLVETLDGISVHIFEMSESLAGLAAKVSRERLTAIMRDTIGKEPKFPNGSDCCLLRLIGLLFSVSDARHAVVSPLQLYFGQCLNSIPFRIDDMASSLFIVSLFMSFLVDSKRYVPEIVCFLREILISGFELDNPYLHGVSADNEIVSSLDFIPLPNTFINNGFWKDILNEKPVSLEKLELSALFENGDYLSTASARVSSFFTTICLVKQMSTLYAGLPSYSEVFQPFLEIFEKLSKQFSKKSIIQDEIKAIIAHLKQEISNFVKNRRPLELRSFKPVPLRSMAPLVEDDTRDSSRDERETKRLKKKLKEEKKGAVRELKKDSNFLALEKIREEKEAKAKSDKKRKLNARFMNEQARDTNPFRMERLKNKKL